MTTQTTIISPIDVVVIGAGPAGMMAAIEAAKHGARVVLVDKNPEPGKKLLITGGGRCNVTNNKPIVREMLSEYKTEGKFLFSTFMQHGVQESMNWFESRGVPLKEEKEGRMFPVTDSARTIRDVLWKELRALGVDIHTGNAVQGIMYTKNQLAVVLANAKVLQAKACVLATGGTARPETGSTGEGFIWAEKLGHTIIPNSNALVPLTVSTKWVKSLAGITLPAVKVTIKAGDEKHSVHSGKLLFTHVGITGPMILNLSKTVGDLLMYAKVTLVCDLFPELDPGEFKAHLQTRLLSNKKLQNALVEDLPLQVVKGVLGELGIDGETPCHSVSRADRMKLLTYLKAVPLEVSGLLGADKAVVSAGGVKLEEVDFKSMQSRIVPGLFFAGDVLNINRPSGGYGLQLCWSTGAVAGKHAAEFAQ